MNKAIFLDRDGVLNEIIYHEEAGIIDTPFTPEQFILIPGAGEGVKALNQTGFKVILVSNQPGLAKNHFSQSTFEAIRSKMKNELAKAGAHLDAEYYCLHHPEARNLEYKVKCDCRKPNPGLLFKAAKDMEIDIKNSWMVGDSITDIKAGKNAGCKTVLIGNMKCDLCRLMDKENIRPDHIATSLIEVYEIIKGGKNGNISGFSKHR